MQERRFVITPIRFMVFMLFFLVFSSLTVWQVMRVFEKQALVELIEQANQGEPLSIRGLTDEEINRHWHYRAFAKGGFDSNQCFFVDNVVKNKQPGFYVYCPFDLQDDQRWLLVNMGWVRRAQERTNLPAYAVATDTMKIEGVVKPPRSKPVVTTGDGRPNTEQPNLWTYFDFDFLKQQSGLDFYPFELQLTSDVDQLLVRDWSGYDAKIGMHIGYAIHWAIFALVTLGVFIKFSIRETDQDE